MWSDLKTPVQEKEMKKRESIAIYLSNSHYWSPDITACYKDWKSHYKKKLFQKYLASGYKIIRAFHTFYLSRIYFNSEILKDIFNWIQFILENQLKNNQITQMREFQRINFMNLSITKFSLCLLFRWGAKFRIKSKSSSQSFHQDLIKSNHPPILHSNPPFANYWTNQETLAFNDCANSSDNDTESEECWRNKYFTN